VLAVLLSKLALEIELLAVMLLRQVQPGELVSVLEIAALPVGPPFELALLALDLNLELRGVLVVLRPFVKALSSNRKAYKRPNNSSIARSSNSFYAI
jgi:hypothetical protein